MSPACTSDANGPVPDRVARLDRLRRGVRLMAALGGDDPAVAVYVADFYRWCRHHGVDPLAATEEERARFAHQLFPDSPLEADAAVRDALSESGPSAEDGDEDADGGDDLPTADGEPVR